MTPQPPSELTEDEAIRAAIGDEAIKEILSGNAAVVRLGHQTKFLGINCNITSGKENLLIWVENKVDGGYQSARFEIPRIDRALKSAEQTRKGE